MAPPGPRPGPLSSTTQSLPSPTWLPPWPSRSTIGLPSFSTPPPIDTSSGPSSFPLHSTRSLLPQLFPPPRHRPPGHRHRRPHRQKVRGASLCPFRTLPAPRPRPRPCSSFSPHSTTDPCLARQAIQVCTPYPHTSAPAHPVRWLHRLL